jgi:hypothetical protein
VIRAGDGKESLEEFDALVKRLHEQYEPIGVVEESLVETIATCWWRKARVIRAENGEIRKRLDTLAVDRAFRNLDKGNLDVALSEMELCLFLPDNQADQQVSSMDRWSALQATQTALRSHEFGLSYLRELLQKAKSEIASDGCISEELRLTIYSVCFLWDNNLARHCLCAGPPIAKLVKDRPSKKIADELTNEDRAAVVAMIDNRLEMISNFGAIATVREKLARDAEARSFSLPPADATDKLLRYESHLDKQLYRAIDELERLQRQRRGENVPPPLNINLGRRI